MGARAIQYRHEIRAEGHAEWFGADERPWRSAVAHTGRPHGSLRATAPPAARRSPGCSWAAVQTAPLPRIPQLGYRQRPPALARSSPRMRASPMSPHKRVGSGPHSGPARCGSGGAWCGVTLFPLGDTEKTPRHSEPPPNGRVASPNRLPRPALHACRMRTKKPHRAGLPHFRPDADLLRPAGVARFASRSARRSRPLPGVATQRRALGKGCHCARLTCTALRRRGCA